MITRAVLYARVSGDDRGTDGRNLKGQLALCRQHAEDKEWRIVAELVEDDRGVSGAELELPELTKMLEMADNREFDVLVVREIDRLSRNLAKQLFIEDKLKKAGVHVEYVLGEYADTPEGNFLKNVRAAVSELERMKIMERTARGRKQAIQAGNVIVSGRPPYGFQVVEVEGRRTLEPREDEAEIVRLIFQWYTRGDSGDQPMALAAIARKLTAMGIPTYAQKRDRVAYNLKVVFPGRWNPATVFSILKNEAYIGIWRYGKRKTSDGKHGFSEKQDQDVVKIAPLIDRATWDLTQARLVENRKHAQRNRKRDYLMSKRLRCSMCGAGMTGTYRKTKAGKMYHYYVCCAKATPQRYSYTCDSVYYRGDYLDAGVWQWLRRLLVDPDLLALGLRAQSQQRLEHNAPLAQQIQSFDALLADKEIRQERLLDLYLDGGITKETWLERKKRIDEEVGHLEQERQGLQDQLQSEGVSDEEIETIQEFAAAISESLDLTDDDFEVRRRVVEMLDVRATLSVTDDGERLAQVSCFFDDKNLTIASTKTTTRCR